MRPGFPTLNTRGAPKRLLPGPQARAGDCLALKGTIGSRPEETDRPLRRRHGRTTPARRKRLAIHSGDTCKPAAGP